MMKRYDFHDDGFDNCDMRLHPEGEFVRYADVVALTARADRAERERDVALALLAAARVCANGLRRIFGDDVWTLDDLDAAIYDSPALAVVEGNLWFDGKAGEQVVWISAQLPGAAEDWPEETCYTVVVLPARKDEQK